MTNVQILLTTKSHKIAEPLITAIRRHYPTAQFDSEGNLISFVIDDVEKSIKPHLDHAIAKCRVNGAQVSYHPVKEDEPIVDPVEEAVEESNNKKGKKKNKYQKTSALVDGFIEQTGSAPSEEEVVIVEEKDEKEIEQQ